MIQSPGTPPTPPLPPAVPGITSVSSRVLNGAPMSAQEVSALRARRSMLSDQLESADGRRKELSQLARDATGADKAGLEQRIGVLDARLARLESDIDETGKLLSSAPAALVSTRGSPDFTFGSRGRDAMDRAVPTARRPVDRALPSASERAKPQLVAPRTSTGRRAVRPSSSAR